MNLAARASEEIRRATLKVIRAQPTRISGESCNRSPVFHRGTDSSGTPVALPETASEVTRWDLGSGGMSPSRGVPGKMRKA